jgi:Ser/Thr protein kinase RdoA (MazF antagonist)
MTDDSPAAEMLAPDTFIPTALTVGLIDADDVVWRGVEVRQVGRSHPVYLLSVGGTGRAVIKSFGPRRGGTDGEPERERAVAALANVRPAVAALAPPLIPWDGPGNVVATRAVDGAVAWSVDRLGGGEEAPQVAWEALVDALAPKLAEMHRATRDLAAVGAIAPPALGGPIPWGLRLFDSDCPPELWTMPQLAPLLVRLGADAQVVAGLRRARGSWRARCLIHGDLKHDNVLLRRGTGGLEIAIVDWEMARIGDPAWDLAALAMRLPMAEGINPPWTEANLAAVARLVATYGAASGIGLPALAQRVIFYTGVWLIMSALQYLSTFAGDAPTGSADGLADAGASTLQRADALTADLMARLE